MNHTTQSKFLVCSSSTNTNIYFNNLLQTISTNFINSARRRD